MKFTSKTLLKVLACTAVTLGAVSLARAAVSASDLTGTWTWTQPSRGGGPDATNTLVLKYDGTTLTGTLASPMGGRGRGGPPPADATTPAPAPPAPTPVDIKDAKVAADGTISFSVTRAGRGGGPDTVIPYSGKLSDDKKSIVGKVTMPARGGGDPTPTDWKATKK
jgi:hypothetical protein